METILFSILKYTMVVYDYVYRENIMPNKIKSCIVIIKQWYYLKQDLSWTLCTPWILLEAQLINGLDFKKNNGLV